MNPLLEGREVACYLGDSGAWVVLARHAAAGEAARSAVGAGAQAITVATPGLADLLAGQGRGAGNGPARRSPDRHHRWPARLGRRLTRPPSRYQARITRPIARDSQNPGPSRQEKTMMMSREASRLVGDFGTVAPNVNRHRPFRFDGQALGAGGGPPAARSGASGCVTPLRSRRGPASQGRQPDRRAEAADVEGTAIWLP
jgi:hypothetical protein